MSARRPVWFIRHGESVANAQGWLAGHRDAALTPLGVAQARDLEPRLADLAPQRVVSSDLRRAWRTAQLGWPHPTPPLEQFEALRERHLGDWEGRSLADLGASKAPLLTWTGRPPGGESHQMVADRVIGWLAEHDDGRPTMLFVHGGLIRTVIGLLDGTPRDQIGSWKVKNTEIVARDVAPDRWRTLLGP